MHKIKVMIKEIVFMNRVTANIYFYKQYGKDLSNSFLISKIQQIAHRFDHQFMRGSLIKRKDLFEMEYFLNIVVSKGIKFQDSLMWALSLYTLAKLNGINSYTIKEMKEKNTNNGSQLSNIIKNRRSIRRWNTSEVNLDIIRDIIATSIWAPSSCNRQPIRVIILEQEQKEFIKGYFPGTFWHEAPVQMLVLADRSTYGDNDKSLLYLDGGAFIQNMLLLLHDKGLGACWIGFKKWDAKKKLFCSEQEYMNFYNYFNIEEELIPLSMIVAGEYDRIPNAPPRLGIRTILIEGEE